MYFLLVEDVFFFLTLLTAFLEGALEEDFCFVLTGMMNWVSLKYILVCVTKIKA